VSFKAPKQHFCLQGIVMSRGIESASSTTRRNAIRAVLDQTAKAIPGTTVEVKIEPRGVFRTVTADGDGKFSASDLAESYAIVVSAGLRLDQSITRADHGSRDSGHSHPHVGRKCSDRDHRKRKFEDGTEGSIRPTLEAVFVATGGMSLSPKGASELNRGQSLLGETLDATCE
jgi:hypothetical protein